jgi:hypothetical protein
MISKEIIGRKSEPVINRIELEQVRRFTEAIGIPFKGNFPPTFIMTLKSGNIPGLEMPIQGAIHAGQKFKYYRRISIGDIVVCTRRVVDHFVRQGKSGNMTFITQEIEGYDLAEDLVFTATSTLIIREEK